MAVTTAAGIYSEFALNGQHIMFGKANVVSTGNTWATSWAAAGLPGAGTGTTTGKANGATCSRSTAGSIWYNNPRAGRRLYVVGATITGSGNGALTLVDRLAHVTLAQNEATGSITGVTGTARLDSASAGNNMEGGQILVEVASVLGAGDNVFTIGYTNQAGTASRVTPQFTLTGGTAVSRIIPVSGHCYIPLQDGDRSVRSIDAITLVSGANTGGTFTVALVRPILDVPWVANIPFDRDYVGEQCLLPEVIADSCLHFVGVPTGSSFNPWGVLRFVDV